MLNEQDNAEGGEGSIASGGHIQVTQQEKEAIDRVIYVFISSPEQNVLKVSFSGHPMLVVRRQHLPCGHFRGHISCSIDLKVGQNVCLDKISDEFEFWPPWVIN